MLVVVVCMWAGGWSEREKLRWNERCIASWYYDFGEMSYIDIHGFNFRSFCPCC
jgi:hypothetical protein